MFKAKSGFVASAALACALFVLPAMADSQARIVRLSDVQGAVSIDKNTGSGFERAFLNLPITQGAKLQTGDTGRAEIEFEDGSTFLLGPNTKVDFSKLSLTDSGKRVSVVNVRAGLAYVNWIGKSGDDMTANFARESTELTSPADVRLETSPSASKFAVFKGDVEVTSPDGKVNVEKKKMAVFDDNDGKYKIAKIEELPLDNWNKESNEYHNQYARVNRADVSPYGYGYSDLNYYGTYFNVPGYGMMWQPYFTGVGWDPFMDGAWSFYPGMGYMFVSAYPWGWMPYRYGSWAFIPAYGWMWQPGYWNGYAMTPRYAATTATTFRAPVAPTGTTRTVVVGRGGPTSSVLASNTFHVTRGSAGLGVPRGSFDNLKSLNHEVAKSGAVTVRPMPPFASTNTGRSMMATGPYGGRGEMGGERGGAARGEGMHEMSAPVAHSSAPSSGGSHH